MRRLMRIPALASALGIALGLGAVLTGGQPAGAGPVFPPDPYHGETLCIGTLVNTDPVVVRSNICVPAMQGDIEIQRNGPVVYP
jgi:hypothetical protein